MTVVILKRNHRKSLTTCIKLHFLYNWSCSGMLIWRSGVAVARCRHFELIWIARGDSWERRENHPLCLINDGHRLRDLKMQKKLNYQIHLDRIVCSLMLNSFTKCLVGEIMPKKRYCHRNNCKRKCWYPKMVQWSHKSLGMLLNCSFLGWCTLTTWQS